MKHDELVERAARWLRNHHGCRVVITEPVGQVEEPDAIGWRSGFVSVLVECKASRSDFFADQKKSFRYCGNLGMGMYRWYLTPPGLLKASELPDGWGLAEVRGSRIKRIVEAQARYPHNYAVRREVAILTAELGRIQYAARGRKFAKSSKATRRAEALAAGIAGGEQR